MRQGAGPSSGAQRLLILLGRFGFVTPGQAAAWLACTEHAVWDWRRELEPRGFISRLQVAGGRGSRQRIVLVLTPRGRDALRRMPGRPVPGRGVTLARLDPVLGAVDLALELQTRGDGTWQTWGEYRATHPGSDVPRCPPAGVLVGADGGCTPIWLVLVWSQVAGLEAATRVLYRRLELEPGRVFAPPALCPRLEGIDLRAEVAPWTPPHLKGRMPLGPGWCHAVPSLRAATAPAGGGRLTLLGGRMLSNLVLLDRCGYATCAQLALASGTVFVTMRRSLAALERRGLAQRWRESPGHGRPEAWSATAPGLRTIGSNRVPVGARPMHRRHSLALVDLALEIEASGAGRWEAERELRSEMGWQSGWDRVTPPDGRLTLPDGRRVLIQLQLSTGNPAESCRNAWRLCHRGWGDVVRFVCVPEVAPAYRRALQTAETGFIEVAEWTPPDRSGRVHTLDPPNEARWRAARERRAAARHLQGT